METQLLSEFHIRTTLSKLEQTSQHKLSYLRRFRQHFFNVETTTCLFYSAAEKSHDLENMHVCTKFLTIHVLKVTCTPQIHTHIFTIYYRL